MPPPACPAAAWRTSRSSAHHRWKSNGRPSGRPLSFPRLSRWRALGSSWCGTGSRARRSSGSSVGTTGARGCPTSGASRSGGCATGWRPPVSWRTRSALYSSLMPRAIETAEILAPALGGLEVRSRVRLLRGPPGRGRRAHLGGARRALPGGAGWDGNTKRAPGLGDVGRDGGAHRRRARVARGAAPGRDRGRRLPRRRGGALDAALPRARPRRRRHAGVDRARQLVAHRVALRAEPVREVDAAGAARPLQRPRPPRRARAPAPTRSSVTSCASPGGGIQRGSTSSLGSRGRMARSMALHTRVRAPEEQHRREARHEEAGDEDEHGPPLLDGEQERHEHRDEEQR